MLSRPVVFRVEPVADDERRFAVRLGIAFCPRFGHGDDGTGGCDDPAFQPNFRRLSPRRPSVVGIVGPPVAELGDPRDAATRRQELAEEQAARRRAARVDQIRAPGAKEPATGAPGIRQPAGARVGPVERVGIERRGPVQQARAWARSTLARGHARLVCLRGRRRGVPESVAQRRKLPWQPVDVELGGAHHLLAGKVAVQRGWRTWISGGKHAHVMATMHQETRKPRDSQRTHAVRRCEEIRDEQNSHRGSCPSR
jgi:hypothetical protein